MMFLRRLSDNRRLNSSKKMRLHQTRTMIVSNGLSAGEVVYKAGCNNASQFSRECKRQFGLPSGRAAEIL
jgi:AraC-like DNA-binding protein